MYYFLTFFILFFFCLKVCTCKQTFSSDFFVVFDEGKERQFKNFCKIFLFFSFLHLNVFFVLMKTWLCLDIDLFACLGLYVKSENTFKSHARAYKINKNLLGKIYKIERKKKQKKSNLGEKQIILMLLSYFYRNYLL